LFEVQTDHAPLLEADLRAHAQAVAALDEHEAITRAVIARFLDPDCSTTVTSDSSVDNPGLPDANRSRLRIARR